VFLALALVGAFLAGGLLMNSATTQADEPSEIKVRGTLYPRWKEIGLSKEQIQQVYKIRSDYGIQIDKLSAQIKKLRAEERAEAEKILTPAQKARLVELLTNTGEKDKTTKDKPDDKSKDKAPEKDKGEKDKNEKDKNEKDKNEKK
jgi:Spy/CpxP family protein refolding chaperone